MNGSPLAFLMVISTLRTGRKISLWRFGVHVDSVYCESLLLALSWEQQLKSHVAARMLSQVLCLATKHVVHGREPPRFLDCDQHAGVHVDSAGSLAVPVSVHIPV